eukprot:jgi/Mesen1/1518/ME000132S00457
MARLFDEFLGAFMGVVFDRELVVRQQSVVPFMLLVPRLPDATKARMRDALIPRASRMDFFAYAEAFAALVHLEFVSITDVGTGARAAEMRSHEPQGCECNMLTEKCDSAALAELAAVLHTITDDVFQYDINYIGESMGWGAPPGSAGDGGGGGGGAPLDDPKQALPDSLTGSTGLRAVESYVGHRNTIFTMCYGQSVVESMELPGHYACSMDIHPAHHTLFVCGVAKQQQLAPCVVAYSPAASHARGGWKELGTLSRDSSKLISCIRAKRAMGGQCAMGDGSRGGGRLDERVCYYDVQASSSSASSSSSAAAKFAALQPVRQYSEHEDLITCLSLFPPNPNMFLSGSRDCTVRIWDRRTASSVGMFGSVGKAGRVQAHDAMITCLDAVDTNMVLSASMDTRVKRWDFRTLSSSSSAQACRLGAQGPNSRTLCSMCLSRFAGAYLDRRQVAELGRVFVEALGGSNPVAALPIDDTAVLKVALGGSPGTAAVSTLRGLYIADLGGPRYSARPADPFQDGRRIGRYHDLKWAHASKTLFAAGDDMRVDVYVYV